LAEHINACGGLEHQEAEDYLLELEAECGGGVSEYGCQNVKIFQLRRKYGVLAARWDTAYCHLRFFLREQTEYFCLKVGLTY